MTETKRGGQPGNTNRKFKDPTKRRVAWHGFTLPQGRIDWFEKVFAAAYSNNSRAMDGALNLLQSYFEMEISNIDDVTEVAPGEFKLKGKQDE